MTLSWLRRAPCTWHSSARADSSAAGSVQARVSRAAAVSQPRPRACARTGNSAGLAEMCRQNWSSPSTINLFTLFHVKRTI